MVNFYSHSGTIFDMKNINSGCDKLISVIDPDGNIVNFVVTPETYYSNHEIVRAGDFITCYYDANAPAILIYPPQYKALIIVKYDETQNIKVDYFNEELVSSDGQLKLNISPNTRRLLRNDQPFFGKLTDRNLIVFYGPTTRSIPAQTSPEKIIVWC